MPCAFGRGALPQLLRQLEGLAGERGAALAATLRTLTLLLARQVRMQHSWSAHVNLFASGTMIIAPQQEARYEAISLGAPELLVRLLSESLATAAGGCGACAVASLVCKALARLAAVLAGRLGLARVNGVAALAAALRAGHGIPEAVECLQVQACHAPSSACNRQDPKGQKIQGCWRLTAAVPGH